MFKFINMVFYYVVFSYLVFAVFISIMYDAYRTIAIEKGDPLKSDSNPDSAVEDQGAKRKKELKKFLIWFFGFLPEEKRKSLL